MTCDDAIQLLPWLLNGTLEEGERREIRHHLETCERCREALTETREAWTIFNQHLPSETLVSLAYGEVPQGIDPALAERHLASCPECAAALELARTSRRLEEDDNKIALFPAARPKPASSAGARTWRSIALAASLAGLLVAGGGWFQSFQEVRRLSTELAEKPAAPAPVERPAPPAPPSDSGAQALVAELQARLNGMTRTQEELERRAKAAEAQMAELEKTPRGVPELNTWNQDLKLTGDVVRGEGDEENVIPAGVRATPILPAQEGVKSPTRDIEILDAAGKVVWSSKGLRQAETDDFTFTLPAGFLKPGRYTIQLYSTEGGKRTPREAYKVRVE